MSSNSKPNRGLQRDPKSPAKGHSNSSSSSNSHKPKPKQPVTTQVTINVLPGAIATLNLVVAAPAQAPNTVKGPRKQVATKKPPPSGSGQGKKPAQQPTAVMKTSTLPPVAAKKKK